MRLPVSVLLFLCYAVTYAQTSSGSIQATVISATDGEVVPGVILALQGTNLACVSDEQGIFRFNSIAPGTYAIATHYIGFENDTIDNVVVHGDKVTFLNITIREVRHFAPPYLDYPAFNKRKAIIIGGVQTTLIAGSLFGLHQLWYKQYPREPFHTFNDGREWNQMDKLGHVQSSYSIARISTQLWGISHMNYNTATWIGGLTSFGYLTAIEMMDGYSSGWGFSAGDMIANTAGTALFISQNLLAHDQIVIPKFGFSPSPYAKLRPDLLGNNFAEQLLKDYNGQTYWLSVNVASFLQSDTQFPRWLNVAVGYGANGMTGGHENPVMYNSSGNVVTTERYRQYYVSLDIDMSRVPTRSHFLRVLFDAINFIKIPAPAIEVNKFGVRGHVLKF